MAPFAGPSQDFNGGHPDPNLVYAHELVHIMGEFAALAPQRSGRPLSQAGLPEWHVFF